MIVYGFEPGSASGQMARIIFDPVAETHFLQHFQIVFGAHPQPLRLEQFVLRFQLDDALFQLFANGAQRAIQFVRRRHELFRREKRDDVKRFVRVTGQRIESRDRIDFVTEKFESDSFFIGASRINLDHVASHTKSAAREIHVVALIQHVDQTTEHRFARDVLSAFHREQHLFIIFRRRDAVDAGDAGDHDCVAARQQRAGGRESQPLDLFVDRRILLDVRVGARDVSFRLIIIEVADEIFDRVPREELFELGVKLRGQGFVVRNDERRPIQLLDHVGNGEGLTRAGHTEQCLMAISGLDRLQQLRDCLSLVAARFVVRFELKRHSINLAQDRQPRCRKLDLWLGMTMFSRKSDFRNRQNRARFCSFELCLLNLSSVQLQIGHVLFMDVVGYSKLLLDEQRQIQEQLTEIVRDTEQVRVAKEAGKLIRLPTGDGMALVFFDSPEAPVRCAIEISKRLKEYPQLKLRMGIHSGPINEVRDVNDRTNVAGAGINLAQRVMDCGDGDHILLSKRVAEDLAQSRRWTPYLHDLGECTVKHGVPIFLVNFYGDDFGNPQLPRVIQHAQAEQAAKTAAISAPPRFRARISRSQRPSSSALPRV